MHKSSSIPRESSSSILHSFHIYFALHLPTFIAFPFSIYSSNHSRSKHDHTMKMQSSLALLLFLAICLVACHSSETDMGLKPISRNDEQQTEARGAEAVVHDRRGAKGGSDLTTKPSQTKNGADDLPVGVVSFWVSMVVSCFFLLQI